MDNVVLTKTQAKQIAHYIYETLDEYINSNLEAFNEFLKKQNEEVNDNEDKRVEKIEPMDKLGL